MGDCGVSCAKYSVFIFNLLFALTGIAILTVGTFIYTAYHHYSNFIGENLWSAPVLLMIIGGVVFLIAFLGCCGAIKESPCMVLTFSILLIVIFLFEIGIGITGYTKHDQLNQILDKGFNETLRNYDGNREAWRLIQNELECCGVDGPDDWEQVFHNSTLPSSCCHEFTVNTTVCTKENASKRGCKPILLKYLDSKSAILGGVGIGVGLIQIIGLGYACCLYRAFRRNYEAV